MGRSRKHIPVKLIAGLISNKTRETKLAERLLEKKFGNIDGVFGPADFSCTSYYENEFGKKLKRKFLSFKRLIPLEKQYKIKLYTNALEKKLSRSGVRLVNIDPGYVSLTKLVLFTTKPRSHRIYIANGVCVEAELMFSDESFRPLNWAYPDYKTKDYLDFFNSVREKYFLEISHYLKGEAGYAD